MGEGGGDRFGAWVKGEGEEGECWIHCGDKGLRVDGCVAIETMLSLLNTLFYVLNSICDNELNTKVVCIFGGGMRKRVCQPIQPFKPH